MEKEIIDAITVVLSRDLMVRAKNGAAITKFGDGRSLEYRVKFAPDGGRETTEGFISESEAIDTFLNESER